MSTLIELEAACHRLIAENDKLRALAKKVAKLPTCQNCPPENLGLVVEAMDLLGEEKPTSAGSVSDDDFADIVKAFSKFEKL